MRGLLHPNHAGVANDDYSRGSKGSKGGITTINQSVVGAFAFVAKVVAGCQALVVVGSGFLLAGRLSAAVLVRDVTRARKPGEAGILAAASDPFVESSMMFVKNILVVQVLA